MLKNKKLYLLKVSFLCAVIILSANFTTKFVSVSQTNNTASVFDYAKSFFTKKITIKDGQIITFHVDDFVNGKSSFRYEISSGKTKYQLIPSHDLGYISGKATVSGVVSGNKIFATPDVSKIIKTNVVRNPEDEEVESHRTLVFLINYTDSGPNPFTNEEAHDIIFNNEFDAYMKEQSFNKVDFEGDVYGWFTFGSGSAFTLDALAIENNINIQNYDHVLYIYNASLDEFGNPDPEVGWSSLGEGEYTLGEYTGFVSQSSIVIHSDVLQPLSEEAPFDWSRFDAWLSHELGHGLGLPHANGLDCGTTQVTPPCSNLEYGNHFDMMGGFQNSPFTHYSSHYNAFYKKLLGWFKPINILTISQSGTYSLSNMESMVDFKSKKLALIQLPGQEEPIYAIEYRKNIGFDAQLGKYKSGLYINKLDLSGDIYTAKTALIDTSPSEEVWLEDSADSVLNIGSKFSDPQNGLFIRAILSTDPNLKKFKVIICPNADVLCNI